MQEHVDYIEAVAIFATNYVKDASVAPSKEMRSVVNLLYEAMLKLDFGTSAQDSIARLCEAWYAGKMEDCDQVSHALIGHALIRHPVISHHYAIQLHSRTWPSFPGNKLQMHALSFANTKTCSDDRLPYTAGCSCDDPVSAHEIGARNRQDQRRQACLRHEGVTAALRSLARRYVVQVRLPTLQWIWSPVRWLTSKWLLLQGSSRRSDARSHASQLRHAQGRPGAPRFRIDTYPAPHTLAA
jgi:hypothetical protein